MDNLTRCYACEAMLPPEAFYPDKSKAIGHGSLCRPCTGLRRKAEYAADPDKYRAKNAAYYAAHRSTWRDTSRQLRIDVLNAYGDRCVCCGETTPEFLGIDHVNNDGEKHRRELRGYGRSIYRWLKMNGFPQDGRFQLLCHNCNMAKGLYGGCPHQGTPLGRRFKTAA